MCTRHEKVETKNGRSYYKYECNCGNFFTARSDAKPKSCGCLTEALKLKNRPLLENSVYELLSDKAEIVNQKSIVTVKCKNCDSVQNVSIANAEKTKKFCSFCRSEAVTTLVNNTPLRRHIAYQVWDGIMQRCTNPKAEAYKNYGAIGINVCSEWESSKAFCLWADSTGYHKGLSIDRIDPTKGYSPDNCRWVPMIDQRENKHIPRNNTTGYTGVSFNKQRNKYEAYYTYNRVKHNCGLYNTAEEAHKARLQALESNAIKYKRSKREHI